MKIATTNIKSGGGDRYKKLCDHILDTDSDYHVITEFRPASSVAELIQNRLYKCGYYLSFVPAKPRQNCVAIASKTPIETKNFGAISNNQVLITNTGHLDLIGLYTPQTKVDKLFLTEFVKNVSCIKKPTLIIGDWNAGLHFIDEQYKVQKRHKDMLQMYTNGWSECWRMFNDQHAKEYTWHHPRTNNGFRIDQAFIQSEFSSMISNSYYDHNPRISGKTDHSTLVVALN